MLQTPLQVEHQWSDQRILPLIADDHWWFYGFWSLSIDAWSLVTIVHNDFIFDFDFDSCWSLIWSLMMLQTPLSRLSIKLPCCTVSLKSQKDIIFYILRMWELSSFVGACSCTDKCWMFWERGRFHLSWELMMEILLPAMHSWLVCSYIHHHHDEWTRWQWSWWSWWWPWWSWWWFFFY